MRHAKKMAKRRPRVTFGTMKLRLLQLLAQIEEARAQNLAARKALLRKYAKRVERLSAFIDEAAPRLQAWMRDGAPRDADMLQLARKYLAAVTQRQQYIIAESLILAEEKEE